MSGGTVQTHGEPKGADHAAGPVRLCASTRSERPIADLIRFVAAPDGTIVPDLGAKLPGRGVWLTLSRAVVAKAAGSGVFARSLKSAVKSPPELADLVERALIERVQNALSIANKAGLVCTGFAQVEAAIATGGVTALLHAADAAEGGRDKLDRKYQAAAREKAEPPRICGALTIEQMSLAMGRANVVHAALNQGGAAEKFISEAGRLERFRSGSPAFLQSSQPTK